MNVLADAATEVAGAGSFDPWAFRAHPDVWVLMACLAAGYWWTVHRLGPRVVPAGTVPVSGRQQTFFWSGLAIMWLASDWPLHDLADSSLYSAHMAQHLVLSFVAPPLLLAGVPRWLADELLRSAGLLRFVKYFGRAVPAAILFNAYQVTSHWPSFVNLTVESAVFHFFAHVALVGTALLMWMPVVGPYPELRIQKVTAMLYLFLQSVIPTVPGAWLTFADRPLFTAYEGLPKAWGIGVLEDQQAAGLIMKLAGGFYLWAWITVLFFRWAGEHDRTTEGSYRRDRRPTVGPPSEQADGDDRSALTTEDVARAFQHAGPPRPEPPARG